MSRPCLAAQYDYVADPDESSAVPDAGKPAPVEANPEQPMCRRWKDIVIVARLRTTAKTWERERVDKRKHLDRYVRLQIQMRVIVRDLNNGQSASMKKENQEELRKVKGKLSHKGLDAGGRDGHQHFTRQRPLANISR